MKFITVIFSFLLLSYGFADNSNNADSRILLDQDDFDETIGMLSEVPEVMDVDDQEEVVILGDNEAESVVNDWDQWLMYFARDAWGEEVTFEPSDGNILRAGIQWVWEQLPSMEGMGLAAGQEAFVRGYNIVLHQEGPEGMGVRQAQVCLEQVYYQFVYGALQPPPIATWLVPALAVVRNREYILAGRCG